MPTRRQFLTGLGALAAGAGVWPLARGQVIDVSHRSLRLWDEPGAPWRVGHVSDLHFSRDISLAHIREAFDLLLATAPDLICVTGDFVTDQAPDPAALVGELRRLARAAPTLACLGNHDGGRWSASRGGPREPDAVIEMVRAAGLQLLHERSERITLKNRTAEVAGVADLWSHPIETPGERFGPSPHPRIVLAHNPDTKDELARAPWNLMLSGHTHGGQIRLPWVGGRLTAPVRDDRYIEGLLPWEGRHLHISRGVGSLYGLRYNCPPEVTLLELG